MAGAGKAGEFGLDLAHLRLEVEAAVLENRMHPRDDLRLQPNVLRLQIDE